MHSMAMGFAFVPLSHIAVPEDAPPHAISVLDSSGPFTVVDFSVGPIVDAFAMRFPLKEIAFIGVSIRVPFKALAAPDIVHPSAFVDPVLTIEHDAESLT